MQEKNKLALSGYKKNIMAAKIITNMRTNGPAAHLRLFVLSKFMVTILKTETYGYGSWHSLKSLESQYPIVTWYGI